MASWFGLLCLQLIVALVHSATVIEQAPKWDHLSGTFRKYIPFPMTEEKAKSMNGTFIADDCANSSSPFHGRRYRRDMENPAIMIFDVHGNIAGMQLTFNADLKQGEYRKYAGAWHKAHEADGDYYYLTAYFTEPKSICDKNINRPEGIIGDRLFFRVGEDKYIEAPLLREDTNGTKWTLGRCFPGMGTHYWYDVSRGMDCDDIFPFFLLYNKKGHLNAWGFSTDIQLEHPRVEHPPWWFIPMFFKTATLPICLGQLDHRTTMHVYFTKVGEYTHRCLNLSGHV